MSIGHRYFTIHGDNIVECERALHLIGMALEGERPTFRGPYGSPTNPSFEFTIEEGKQTLEFVFFPGFGRWNVDIRQMVRDRGGIIREAPDVIICEIMAGQEHPLMAMEYSGALAAGNQAWQRSGRAYSFGLAKIPYLYVAELGGYELDQLRTKRATRFPNPAVPFSYLSYSSALNVPVLPVYVLNPGASDDTKTAFASVIGEDTLVDYINKAILKADTQSVAETLQKKALAFVQMLASGGRKGRTLTPEQWAEAYDVINDADSRAFLPYLLDKAALRWSKTAYIQNLTVSAKELMEVAARLSIGLTSANLPICIVPSENRTDLAKEVERLYPKVDSGFLTWLRSEEELVICWVMGFKPRGDDARPDRGLPPLARMLIGPGSQLLTVVYGPAPPAHWSLLSEAPTELAQQNGLWEAIMVASNAILVDSATDNVTSHGFLRTHWEQEDRVTTPTPMLVSPMPQRITENDVDTVIHTMFARLGSGQVFEGLCNPPGGDWSGVSVLTQGMERELRWLSLPRVSGVESKRPDHVLQIFGVRDIPILLAIESKESHGSVEARIGQRLKNYMSNLLSSPASIERENGRRAEWKHSEVSLGSDDFLYASAAASLFGNDSDLKKVMERANTDLQIGLRFSTDTNQCQVHLLPGTDLGESIAEFINGLALGDIGLSIHIHQ